MPGRVLLICTAILLTDALLWAILRRDAGGNRFVSRLLILHLLLAAAFLVFSAVLAAFTGDPEDDPGKYRRYILWTNVFLSLYLPKLILVVTLLPLQAAGLIAGLTGVHRRSGKSGILRAGWISLSLVLALGVMILTLDGILAGKSRLRIRQVAVHASRLPAAFEGYRIVHLSDLHLGSYYRDQTVAEAVRMAGTASANLIVFTGDLINLHADELADYVQLLRKLAAPDGTFAVLGNHDLGDFARPHRDLRLGLHRDALSRFYRETGITLLENEHRIIHRRGDSIRIAGVDNWSRHRFTRFGNLAGALQNADDQTFTILLSHDPSHWRAEILPGSRVDLTLSGHTHGGQLGIRTNRFQWSPVQYLNEEWMGLYREGERYLYVNPGIGVVGFSGRIGIRPEITVITLYGK